MVIVVLIVSIASLYVVGSSLWRTISPGLYEATDVLGLSLNLANANYNFEVPEEIETVEDPTENEEPQVLGSSDDTSEDGDGIIPPEENFMHNFNFPIPEPESDPYADLTGVEDSIVEDALQAGYTEDNPSQKLTLEIPILGFASTTLQNLPADITLQNGLLEHPNSSKLGEGEVILMCYRRYHHPEDPRSCLYLSELESGDHMQITYRNQDLNYVVVGIDIVSASNTSIYQANEDHDYIKLITAHPFLTDNQRLVILAKPMG